MFRRERPVWLPTMVPALVVCAAAAYTGPQSPARPPEAGLVPMVVHVLDRDGKPVTDLTQGDFTVTEDGLPQQVRTFAAQTLAARATPAGEAPVLRQGVAWSAPQGRMFAILLGLGRLEEPSRYVSALVDFVKTRLLPQDLVALFAYDRALPFTTDHQAIVAALERFRKAHDDVDYELGKQLGDTGMAPLYGTRVLPRKLQARIDEMVVGPGAKPASTLPAEVVAFDAFTGLSLDDFMASSAMTLRDQGNLMALVEYLRRFDGRKDVLFVTEHGFPGPTDQNDRALASVANDARASIHVLRAGGLLAAETGKELTATAQQAMSLRSLRTIADLTGGLAAIDEKGTVALERIDGMTRTGYVLGYQASRTAWSGEYRNIVVTVKRPGVTVLHRHGYFREAQMGGFNRRGFVVNDRLAQAGNFRREMNDIKVKASASRRNNTVLIVEGKIDLSKVALAAVNGSRTGQLHLAVFSFDSGSNPMGAHVADLPLTLTEDEYTRAVKGGFPYSVQFPLDGGTHHIRFVVYDFGSDLAGRVDTDVF